MAEKRIELITSMWELRSELEILPPFNRFSDIVNEKIARASTKRIIEKGVKIIRENEKGFQFYIILKGSFAVTQKGKKIGKLGPGEIFGEYSVLSNKLRNATIESMEKSVVFEMSNKDINHILETSPGFQFIINQLLLERHEKIE